MAVFCKIILVAAMSRINCGRADQSNATTPTTCGPAIDVPDRVLKVVSLVEKEERTLTPGAEMFGFKRLEPSTVIGPRLLKDARVFVEALIAPVENAAS